jgi:hypothetical protein
MYHKWKNGEAIERSCATRKVRQSAMALTSPRIFQAVNQLFEGRRLQLCWRALSGGLVFD